MVCFMRCYGHGISSQQQNSGKDRSDGYFKVGLDNELGHWGLALKGMLESQYFLLPFSLFPSS